MPKITANKLGMIKIFGILSIWLHKFYMSKCQNVFPTVSQWPQGSCREKNSCNDIQESPQPSIPRVQSSTAWTSSLWEEKICCTPKILLTMVSKMGLWRNSKKYQYFSGKEMMTLGGIINELVTMKSDEYSYTKVLQKKYQAVSDTEIVSK